MIPSVAQDPSSIVAIAPAPSIPIQQSADLSNEMKDDEIQANTALEIVQQPPETWYKDQFGRKATFELKVKRTETFCAQCVKHRILTVKLLYESGKMVERQEILHVKAGQCLDKYRQSTLALRIDQVSKNHLNQRFCVKIAISMCSGQCEYIPSVVSEPVLVLSKKKKQRSVKENEEMESLVKVKKAKRSLLQRTRLSSDSRESLQLSGLTATITGNVTAEIAEIEEIISPQVSDSTAPFTPKTPNLCLWANAAFDLLYKLQWQRIPASTTDKPGTNLDAILAQALSKAYKCPSCQATYWQVPIHQDDCDLKMLLEQGGHTDMSTIQKTVHSTAHSTAHHRSVDRSFERPDRSKAMYNGGDITPKSPYNLARNCRQLSGRVSKQESTKGCAATAMAANVSIGFWKDYALLSKLLYSTTYVEAKSRQAGTLSSSAQQWTGGLPPVETLSPALSSLTNSCAIPLAGVQQSFGFQQFSSLLSATKDMSPDAAKLLREGEASLHGDGNIVKSLGSMNLSEIIRSNSGERYGIDLQLTSLSSSLSALMSGNPSTSDMSSEERVQTIMGADFLDCGFPALDALFNLVGFYHLATKMEDSPAELRFAPNLFPLPVEMLQELENTITKWKANQSITHRLELRNNSHEDSLARLKSAVLRQVTHSKLRLFEQ